MVYCQQKRKDSYMSKQYKPTIKVTLNDGDFKVSGWCGNRPKCVQVANKRQVVALRDSKDPTKTTLTFSRGEWNVFVKGVKAGEFD